MRLDVFTDRKTISNKTKLLNVLRNIWKFPPFEFFLALVGPYLEFGSFLTRPYPNHYQFPKYSFRLKTRGGINYILDISDMIDWAVYFGFTWRPESNLFTACTPGFVVLDVGANIGSVAMRLAQRAGPGGTVHCFELDPANYSRLRRNLSINRFPNIHTHNIALGHKPGSVAVEAPDATNSGRNRVSENPGSSCKSVAMHTIDAFVRENNLYRVDLIKIDAEGFEKNVLIGAEQTLKIMRPLLFIEVVDAHLRHFGSSAPDLVVYIENFGYELFHSVTGERIVSTMRLADCQIDVFAVPGPGPH